MPPTRSRPGIQRRNVAPVLNPELQVHASRALRTRIAPIGSAVPPGDPARPSRSNRLWRSQRSMRALLKSAVAVLRSMGSQGNRSSQRGAQSAARSVWHERPATPHCYSQAASPRSRLRFSRRSEGIRGQQGHPVLEGVPVCDLRLRRSSLIRGQRGQQGHPVPWGGRSCPHAPLRTNLGYSEAVQGSRGRQSFHYSFLKVRSLGLSPPGQATAVTFSLQRLPVVHS